MIGTIRKHSKWLWMVIIVLTVYSFIVLWGNPSSRSTGRGASGNIDFGSINGKKITPDDYYNAQREVAMDYFLASGGQWPDRETKEMQSRAYLRLMLIQKLDDYNIHTGDEAVAQMANNVLRAYGERLGRKLSLGEFVQKFLNPHASVEDFERYVRHYLGIQQLSQVVGLSGDLVTPAEARELYEREHQELSVQAVFFSGSNFLAAVKVTPEDIARFYTNEMAAYRLPERRQVSYVEFSVTNFWAQAEKDLQGEKTNLAETVETKFREIGTNYLRLARTPEEAKAKIREELIRDQALRTAYPKANQFANELFAMEPARPENLAALAKSNNLTVKITEPFDKENGPKDLEVSPNFTKFAFALTTDDPFARPLVENDGIYQIALNKILPSEIPPLDKIRGQVAADCKYDQAVLLARQAGTNFIRALALGIAQKKTFPEICIEANQRPVLLPPFSLSTGKLPQVEEHLGLSQFQELAFATPVSKASTFEPTREGGVIVYVQQRLPLDETKMSADLPAYTRFVRQRRQQEAFNLWFNDEANKSLRNTLFFQLQAEINGTGRTPGR
jgi:SurA-like N-terminal domain